MLQTQHSTQSVETLDLDKPNKVSFNKFDEEQPLAAVVPKTRKRALSAHDLHIAYERSISDTDLTDYTPLPTNPRNRAKGNPQDSVTI
eukprot:gene20752-1119_t